MSYSEYLFGMRDFHPLDVKYYEKLFFPRFVGLLNAYSKGSRLPLLISAGMLLRSLVEGPLQIPPLNKASWGEEGGRDQGLLRGSLPALAFLPQGGPLSCQSLIALEAFQNLTY